MELKYDIYTIKNSQGSGEDRQYVRLVQHEPMTDKELEAHIQNRCSHNQGREPYQGKRQADGYRWRFL